MDALTINYAEITEIFAPVFWETQPTTLPSDPSVQFPGMPVEL